MATPEDYLIILYVDDGAEWANFLSARLSGPNYGIKSMLRNVTFQSDSDQTSSQSPPAKAHGLQDSGRGSCTIPELNFCSDPKDSSKARVFLLSPDMISSAEFPVDISCINSKRSVFLFLGVEIEEVRSYFGPYSDDVFRCHCSIIHSDEKSICDAMVKIIEAYEDCGEGSLEDEDDHEAPEYKQLSSTAKQLNRIEKVMPAEICGTDREIHFLLQRPADDTLVVVLEKGEELPVTHVCDRLYKFTLPASANGEVLFKVECQNYTLCEDSVLVLTKLDKLKSILNQEVSPLSAISAALGLSSDDIHSIDEALALKMQQLKPVKTFQQMFPCEEALNNSLTEDRSDVTYPSLLHFAADWNLRKFCCQLLHYPGMLAAAITENKNGDDPCTIAYKKGYTGLESDLIHFIEDHKTSEECVYVQPLAPKPHTPVKRPDYVNLPQSTSASSGIYIDMGNLKDCKKSTLESSSQRSDTDSVSLVSQASENVFSDQSSLIDDFDAIDQSSSADKKYNLRSNSLSVSTPIKALKRLGVNEEDINPPKAATMNKTYPRSEYSATKQFVGHITYGVRYPGVSNMPPLEQERNNNYDDSAVYGVPDTKHKASKLSAFFSKIKSKRSASEGENIYASARQLKKTQSSRSDKLKKKVNEDSSQERDSGSYSDEENGKIMPGKKSNKPREFKERDKPMTRKRPMSRRALLARQEQAEGAPKVPDTNKNKESFISFLDNY